MTNPFGPGPFAPNPFGAGSPGPQHQPMQPPPVQPRDEANVFATLSVVFAFVFAPAGLILGHLALAQIRTSGGRGRDRALVGVTLSYVFITATVVALIVGATLPDASPSRVAAPTATTTPPEPYRPDPRLARAASQPPNPVAGAATVAGPPIARWLEAKATPLSIMAPSSA